MTGRPGQCCDCSQGHAPAQDVEASGAIDNVSAKTCDNDVEASDTIDDVRDELQDTDGAASQTTDIVED